MKENMLTYISREQETNLSIVKNRKCNLLQTVNLWIRNKKLGPYWQQAHLRMQLKPQSIM